MINLDKCIEQLLRCEMLSESNVKEICDKMKDQMIEESNIASVKSPVTIVGDLHAQFYDMLEIFNVGGKIPDTNYLFMGNYIDRGFFSVETISLLVCFKLKYPNRITLLRGNHECRNISQIYGFYSECIRKYGSTSVWKYFTDLFDYFPISALVDDRIFIVHGGLSQYLVTLDNIRVVDRFMEIPTTMDAPLTELLWSDPTTDSEIKEFAANTGRGAGCLFGQDSVQRFLRVNKLEHIVRGHQLCMDGYQTLFNNKLSTVWSAPNFCGRSGNVASILEVSESHEKYYNTFCACPDSEREKLPFPTLKEFPDYYMV